MTHLASTPTDCLPNRRLISQTALAEYCGTHHDCSADRNIYISREKLRRDEERLAMHLFPVTYDVYGRQVPDTRLLQASIMQTPVSTRGRPRRRLVITAVVLAAVSSLSTASNAEESAELVTPADATGQLPTQDAPYGAIIDDQTIRVSRAKLQFVLPRIYLRAGNLIVCIRDDKGSGTITVGSEVINPDWTKCPKQFLNVPLPPQYTTLQLYGGTADAFVASRDSAGRLEYGKLPPIRIKTLAFGSIPVTAVVHLEQSQTRGFLNPIRGLEVFDKGVPKDTPYTYPGYGVRPPGDDNNPPELMLEETLSGNFDTQISDLQVDGKPINLGPNCRTMKPAQLRVDAARGYYTPLAVPTQEDLPPRGTPNSLSILRPLPGYFDGAVDIPPFRGCGTNGDNLDPLITRLISGKGNPASGLMIKGILDTSWCSLPVSDCTAQQRDAERVRNRAVSSHQSAATINKMTAQLRATGYFAPSRVRVTP